jgi:Family of unknown function (DUF6220)
MSAFRVTYLVFAAITLLLVTLQFFLAGLGIFGATSFSAHETVGGILHVTALLMLVTAAVGQLGRSPIIFGAGLLVLIVIQSALPGARDDAPGIAALHPLLALVIAGGSLQAVQHALAWRRARPAAGA